MHRTNLFGRLAATTVAASLTLAIGPTAWAGPPEGDTTAAESADADAPAEGAEAPAEGGDAAPEAGTPSSDADALSAEAVEAFKAKDYEVAAEKFEAAYEIDKNPNYLFNIGRVYEEAGNLETAVEFYQRFVESAGVDLESREIAFERLKVLEPIVNAGKEPEGDPTATEPEPQPQPEPIDEPKKSPVRTTGFALIGVGGAALIAGGVVGGLALGRQNSAEDSNTLDQRREDLDSAQTMGVAADALYIAGGVVAVSGLIMVLTTVGKNKKGRTARLDPRNGHRTVIAPTMSRHGAGVGVMGRF